MEALGRVLNVVPAASGVHIPLKGASAVTFVTYEDDGSTVLTLKQSIAGQSEAPLSTITRWHKAPGIGGTWTAVSQAAADTIDLLDDTTNDAICVTVAATELGDGYDSIEATVDGGICVAILHDLVVQRDPAKLVKNVV